MDGEEESSLIKKVLGGERDQFQKLVIAYQARVYAMIARIIGDRSIAEDLTQESFLRAYRNLTSFRGQSRFITWLTRIAINLTHNYFSSLEYRRLSQQVPYDVTSNDIRANDPQEVISQELVFQRLRNFVGELPPRYREVVILCSFENKTYQETAEILGIPSGTVASRMNKAFELIRDKFKRLKE